MRILVTGSEGNIGSRLVAHLEDQGHNVYCVDIKQASRSNYRVADINIPTDIMSAFIEASPEVVFHLAAMVSRITCEKSPAITITTNVGGTNNIIQLCKMFRAKLINFSTSEVYGNLGNFPLSEARHPLEPNNLYGVSKLMAEELVDYARREGLRATTVRPFMFYDELESLGENRSAMVRFAEALLKKHFIIVHKGAMRSWMHIQDGVKVLDKLMYLDEPLVNIGDPNIVSMTEIAKIMCEILNLPYVKHVIEEPLPPKMTLVKKPDLRIQQRVAPLTDPIPLREGIEKVIESVRKRTT